MISGINNYNYLSMLFKNPVSPSDTNSAANTMYGAFITAKYSPSLNRAASKELSTYMKSISANINNLKTAADKLTVANPQSVLTERSAAVENSKILTATASANATKKQYMLKVDNVATAQVNTGSKLKAADFNSFTTGTNTLKITAGSKTAEISIDIKSTQTNKDIMNAVSDKINKLNIGVKSSVLEDKDGNASLQLTDEKTGKDNTFTVTGTLADQLGLNNKTQTAADAKYEVDGKEYTSATNDIKLDNGKVAVKLQAAGETKLTVGDDTNKLTAAVKAFVKSYNDTVDSLDGVTGSKAADQLKRQLTNTMKFKKAGLESIGINVNSSGELSVDENKLKAAASNSSDKIKNVLSTASGAAARVSKTAEDALKKPPQLFMDQSSQQNNSNNTSLADYYNYMSTAQKVYMNTKQQQGYLFDAFL